MDNGRVKKGINFVNLVDIGDPAAIAAEYERQGADELVFLDITATNQKRQTMKEVVESVSRRVFMPLTVGGGIKSVAQMQLLLKAGADKISLNTAAVVEPQLITKGAQKFGRQCIVVAIDVKKNSATGQYMVFTSGGQHGTGLDALDWAEQAVSLGAGELLVTSMDKDGTKSGFDTELYRELTERVDVPIIASGGAGKLNDFTAVFCKGKVDGALAASVFHYGELTISGVKDTLKKAGVNVR
ncbi:imidazole glycerol phosphate synthase subunit HisF [Liquorilactobacillus oeni DSM 19972]|uniref:Imidazole glycerol phosphate synthase subunit HisF n=1 Tax=Liquorilactobacillus oeni DSM 19972 TaxID=1423777 RepID=A0A0R1M710_9LACO|nr:imidazole glycerol phosphate synthase subunit HisF [Liquorilactobacillus oeni DSM 19972]